MNLETPRISDNDDELRREYLSVSRYLLYILTWIFLSVIQYQMVRTRVQSELFFVVYDSQEFCEGVVLYYKKSVVTN